MGPQPAEGRHELTAESQPGWLLSFLKISVLHDMTLHLKYQNRGMIPAAQGPSVITGGAVRVPSPSLTFCLYSQTHYFGWPSLSLAVLIET